MTLVKDVEDRNENFCVGAGSGPIRLHLWPSIRGFLRRRKRKEKTSLLRNVNKNTYKMKAIENTAHA